MAVPAIGIIYNLYKTYRCDTQHIAQEVAQWLAARGENVYVFASHYDSNEAFEKDTSDVRLKMALVLGGDGTVLYAARLLAPHGVPLLCVNAGSLGFISETALEDLYPALERLLAGEYVIQERSMMQIEVLDENYQQRLIFHALNDAAIMRHPLSYIIELATYVDGEYVTTYRADGLIIASATGSTAYSLSSGGPIMLPDVSAYIINPICPHALFNRSVVIPEWKETTVKVLLREPTQEVLITIDGQAHLALHHRDIVKINRSFYKTRLVKFQKNDFFHIMRQKLFLGR